jgi:hypothetical protein
MQATHMTTNCLALSRRILGNLVRWKPMIEVATSWVRGGAGRLLGLNHLRPQMTLLRHEIRVGVQENAGIHRSGVLRTVAARAPSVRWFGAGCGAGGVPTRSADDGWSTSKHDRRQLVSCVEPCTGPAQDRGADNNGADPKERIERIGLP